MARTALTRTRDRLLGLKAAQFTSSNAEYLRVADSRFQMGAEQSFTFTAWVYLDPRLSGSNRTILGKYKYTANEREFYVHYNTNTDRFVFGVSNDGTTVGTVTATNFGAAPPNRWLFVVAIHDAVANTLTLSVNDGTPNSTAYSLGCFVGTSDFQIGAVGQLGASPTEFWNGRISRVGVWKRALSTAEVTTLYAGGAGLRHADLSESMMVSLVEYWNLEETSGNRTGSHAGVVLTDTNTVTAADAPSDQGSARVGIGNARALKCVRASNHNLTAENADASFAQFGANDWMVSVMVKPGSAVTGLLGGIVSLWEEAPNQRSWLLEKNSTNLYRIWLSGNGASTTSPTGLAANIGAWDHVLAWREGNTVYLSVNGSAPNSVAFTGSLHTSTTKFVVGSTQYNSSNDFDGLISRLHIWNGYAGTADERTALYNGGKSLTYDGLPENLRSRVTRSWGMTETDGNRTDRVTSQVLAAVNNPGSDLDVADYGQTRPVVSFPRPRVDGPHGAPGLVMDLLAEEECLYQEQACTNLAVDGGPVGGAKEWQKRSSVWYQTNALYQPTLRRGFVNGRAALQFSAHFLEQAVNLGSRFTQGDRTVICAIRPQDNGVVGAIMGNGQAQWYVAIDANVDNYRTSHARGDTGVQDGLVTPIIGYDTWQVVTFRYQQTSAGYVAVIRRNGTQLHTFTYLTHYRPTTATQWRVGCLGTAASNPIQGYLRRLSVWDRALSDSECARVEASLMADLGI